MSSVVSVVKWVVLKTGFTFSLPAGRGGGTTKIGCYQSWRPGVILKLLVNR